MENITDFAFYLKFAKPLVLNLPEISDRALAAAWVKKIAEDGNTDEKIRLDYLKLLLFVVQRKKLAPPFTQHPNTVETLQSFPENQTLVDVAKSIIEKDLEERRDQLRKKLQGGDYPPYISDFSADLLEYVAVQNIENFGAHGYYAVSKEPLNTWHRIDKQLLPKAAKSMLEVSAVPPTLTESHSTPDLKEKTPAKPPEEPQEATPPSPEVPPPQEEPAPEEPTTPKKEKTPKKKSTLGATPPSRPIGKVSPPPEDREPPTWGSNLLEAKFLEDDMEELVKAAEESLDDSLKAKLLWSSPPAGTSQAQPLSPVGSAAAPRLPFQPDSPLQFQSPPMTYSPHGLAPPMPVEVPPPPLAKKKKKVVPVPRPTRASTLLQKKKERDLAPAPPPPGRRASKSKLKGPKKKKKEEIIFASPGEGFKGFDNDDEMNAYMSECTQLVDELKDDYQQKMTSYRESLAREDSYGKTSRSEKRVPMLARRPPPVKAIPRRHDAPVPLEKSIHVSPEARKIFEGIIDGPSTSAGITQSPDGRLRHPRPILGRSVLGEEPTDDIEEESTEIEEPEDYQDDDFAKTELQGKDPRITNAYNDMMDSFEAEDETDDLDEEIENLKRMEEEAEAELAEMAEQFDMEIPTDSGEEEFTDWEQLHREAVEDLANFEARLKQESPTYTSPPPQYRSPSPPRRPSPRSPRNQALSFSRNQPGTPGRNMILEVAPQGLDDSGLDEFEKLERELEREERENLLRGVAKSPELDEFERLEREAERREQSPERDQFEQLQRQVEARRRTSPQIRPTDEDDDSWMAATDFFAEADREHIRKNVPPRFKDPTGKQNASLENMALMYQDYIKKTPAFMGVPVTTPMKTLTPRRPTNQRGPIDGLLDLDMSPIELETFKELDEENMPLDRPQDQPSIQEKPVYEVKFPPSPPRSPTEFLELPTSPSQVLAKYQPEDWQFSYATPERDYGSSKLIRKVDDSAITPPNRRWYYELDKMHNMLYGTQPKQKTPDYIRKLQYESPPRILGSPVSPAMSPPIDKEQLSSDMYWKRAIPKLHRWSGEVGPNDVHVQHYFPNFVYDMAIDLISEDEDELPPGLTGEDLDRRMELEDYTPVKYERKEFELPYGKTKKLPLKSARPPGLSPLTEDQRETPIKQGPDIFDVAPLTGPRHLLERTSPQYKPPTPDSRSPDVFDQPDLDQTVVAVTPPGYYGGQLPFEPSPPIDIDELRSDIQRGASKKTRTSPHKMRKYGKRPALRGVGERMEYAKGDELEQYKRIMAASGEWEVQQVPRAELPTEGLQELEGFTRRELSPIQSARVPQTPTRPYNKSPSNVGPRRRNLTKQLKRRRLDFDGEDDDPSEQQVEVREVEATIEELANEEEEEDDEQQQYRISPNIVRALMERGHLETPRASPMSKAGVLEGIMQEVKDYTHQPETRRESKGFYRRYHPRKGELVTHRPTTYKTRHRDFYKQRPWRGLEQVTELPVGERVEELHDQMEREVEAEMRKRAEEERERMYVLDEPLGEEAQLIRPAVPDVMVHGYKTPPHLQRTKHHRRQLRDMEKEMGKVVTGMPLVPIVSPEQQQQQQQDVDDEMAEFLKLEKDTEGIDQVTHLVAEVPPAAIAGAMESRRLAEAQYKDLMTPPKKTTPPRRQLREVPAIDEYSPYLRLLAEEREKQGMYDEMMREEEERLRREEKERKKAERERKAQLKEFEYQERIKGRMNRGKAPPKLAAKPVKGGVKETKAQKAAKKREEEKKKEESRVPKGAPATTRGKYKNVKSRLMQGTASDKSVTSKKSEKSIKSAQSDKSIKSSKSDKSVQSSKSESSVTKPRRRRKGPEVKSKINTGLDQIKKKKKKQPVMEVQYEVAALQDLGLTPSDLQQLNLDDVHGTLEATPMEEEYHEGGPSHAPTRSPDRLKSELESHEFYDPDRQMMQKRVRVKGRVVPLQMATPRVSPLKEEEEPSGRRPDPLEWRTGQSEMEQDMAQAMALAGFRLQHGDAVSPIVLEAVSPAGPLNPAEEVAMLEVSRMGGASPSSDANFKYQWM